MIDKIKYNTYVNILKNELMPALGCTEPIALAFAAAKVVEVLGQFPDSIEVKCSGNIIKNVKGVTVPNSGGLKGIDIAVTLGAVVGNAGKKLQVLESVKEEDIERAKTLVSNGFCKCCLVEGKENLYILIEAKKSDSIATVEIEKEHTNVISITKNGETIYTLDVEEDKTCDKEGLNKDLLNVKDIIEFADIFVVDDLKALIEKQIDLNYAIASEGIKNAYGAQVGRTLLDFYDKNDIRVRAKAMAAAASDARMGGCSLPVVINSGSGNQGITLSVPVIEYASELNVEKDFLIRALVLSNLIAILQKHYIGRLSAFCGVVSSATAAASAITYLHGGKYKEISDTITNTLANIGGMVCDGAKASCAAKIASALDAAILGFTMSFRNAKVFQPGDGIVKQDVENTIKSIGKIAKDGMRSTDIEILNIMIDKN